MSVARMREPGEDDDLPPLPPIEAYEGDLRAPRDRAGAPRVGDQRATSGPQLPPVIWYSAATPDLSQPDLIEGLLGIGTLSMPYGPSGSGKTFLLSKAGFCIAGNEPFAGRRVEPGVVIYGAGEGRGSIVLRTAANRIHAEASGRSAEIPFAILPAAIDLLDPSRHVPLVIAIARAAEDRWGLPVRLIVIDTLARSMSGGNENASEVAGAAIQSADRLREETGAHVALVHHTGKNGDSGARGHSSLRAAVDTEIEISGNTGTRIAEVKKQRDTGIGEKIAFNLLPVEVGRHQVTGKPVTSCVVEFVDVPNQRREPSGKNQQLLLGAIREHVRKSGVDVISTPELLAIGKAQGIARGRIPEARKTLERDGWLVECVGGVKVEDPS